MSAPDRLTAALADRYRIERELGQGGMATVYLAHDLKHNRPVAIKVLRPELAAALGADRFLREIETTANLRHPNILPLFDSGVVNPLTTHDSRLLFYVMPFIEGESLRDRLNREKQLTIPDALQLAREVADALGYAHSRGVIHRDIKPENILLERGHAVVADFGIARAVSTAGADKLTQTGMAIGTPAYMSPEQSVGDSDLDARSDLYALGCVLYEMLAGEPPYSGPTAQAIIAKRFMEPVPRISTLRETVSPALETALTRVLAKSPADRFATAEEFVAHLTGQAPQSGTTTVVSQPVRPPEGSEGFWLAVLRFRYSGSNHDLEALAEGLTEEIVTGLSRFSWLRVISLNSTRNVVSNGPDVREIGKELGARYVMEGSVRQNGTTLRVTAQLVDANSGAHLWAETWDRPYRPDAVFLLQDDLVPRIVSTVADAHGILPHALSEALRSMDPEQLTPYEAVLRSFGYGYRMTPEEHAVVRACLERAVQRAPGYADAWGMLSILYAEEFSNGYNARPDPLERALHAARRAADAAPASAIAHNALARALFFRKEFQPFRIAADQAIELNPLNGPTLAGLGAMIAYAGDWERGCAHVERALGLNPRHPGGYWFAPFYNAYRQHDYRGALSVGLKINLPEFFAYHEAMAAAYGQLGESEAAGRSVRDLLRLKPDFVLTASDEIGKWFDRDLVQHLMDGLRKAGLKMSAAPAVAAAPSVRSRRTLAVVGGVAIIAIAVLAAILLRRRPTDSLPVIGRAIQVTRDPGLEIDPALSPDGAMVAYARGTPTRMQIFVQQVTGGRPVAITSDTTGSFRSPRWSPDGTRIAFQGNDGIFVVPALGGAPSRVINIDTAASGLGSGSFSPVAGLAWAPDGQRLAYIADNVDHGAEGQFLSLVPVSGGEVARFPAPAEAHLPAWSPDGTRLAVVSGNALFTFGTGYFGNVGSSSIWVLPIPGGPAVRITDDASLNTSPQWSSDGGALYWVSDRGGSRDIYRVTLDRGGKPKGQPQRLTTGLSVQGISLSRDGAHLAYSSLRTYSNIWSIALPGAGPVSASVARPVTTGDETIENVDVTRDGQWLLFDSDRGGNTDLYKMPAGGGEPVRLTTDSAGDFSAAWSRDGRQIAFHSLRAGNRNIFTMNADGTGLKQRTSAPEQELDPDWGPDDSTLVFQSRGDMGAFTLLPLAGGRAASALKAHGDFAVWSPTGEWIAYHTTEGLELLSPSGGPGRLLVDNAKDGAEAFYAAWAPDGQIVYYLTRRPAGWAIRSVPVTGGSTRTLVLFDDPARQPTRYGFATDGRTFYFTLGSNESDIWVMELKRR